MISFCAILSLEVWTTEKREGGGENGGILPLSPMTKHLRRKPFCSSLSVSVRFGNWPSRVASMKGFAENGSDSSSDQDETDSFLGSCIERTFLPPLPRAGYTLKVHSRVNLSLRVCVNPASWLPLATSMTFTQPLRGKCEYALQSM